MAKAIASSEEDNLYEENKNEWKLIGTLEEILNYPIDTGFGFTSPTAEVSKFGITTTDFAQMTFSPFRIYPFQMKDRTLIPFEKDAATLFTTEVAEIRHTTIINELSMARQANTPPLTLNYLDHPTEVYKIDTAATQDQMNMSPIMATVKLPYNFAYFDQADRYDTFSKLVQQKEPTKNKNAKNNNRYLANYSPFMLINIKSLEALQNETGRHDLSISDFRPNFVIDATTPYCEENILGLKIGSVVEFDNIIHCTHGLTIKGQEENKLFKILKKKHSGDVEHPQEVESSSLPAFGINMQAKKVGKVEIGDKVYAKFNKKHDS